MTEPDRLETHRQGTVAVEEVSHLIKLFVLSGRQNLRIFNPNFNHQFDYLVSTATMLFH